MSAKKDARVKLSQNKKLRRKAITWLRMARYGVNNFSRNAWLTTAATAVMTITLLIVFTTVAARSVLSSTVDTIRDKVEISIFLKNDVTADTIETLTAKLQQDPNVTRVNYTDLQEAKDKYIRENSPTPRQLQIISELDTSPFPPSLGVAVEDPEKIDNIKNMVENDSDFAAALNPDRESSFTGENRKIIDTIGQWVSFAERFGLIVSIIFIAISMLIIFNTIRMAIFNRKEEIQMMKLIGADRNFIRGPFVVEAVMYGFVAAIIATSIGFVGLMRLEPILNERGVAILETKNAFLAYAPLVLLGMIVIGALIGVISSRLAVRRYLKV